MNCTHFLALKSRTHEFECFKYEWARNTKLNASCRWGDKKKKKKDGHEADSESEYTEDEFGNRIKKKKKKRDGSGSSVEVVSSEAESV